MKKERYLREMDDQNDNAFSLIADFDGNEDQVFDIKVGETLPVLPSVIWYCSPEYLCLFLLAENHL